MQAHDTPFSVGPIAKKAGLLSNGKKAHEILDGTYIQLLGMDEFTAKFIKTLCYADVITRDISTAQHQQAWQKDYEKEDAFQSPYSILLGVYCWQL